MVVNVHPTASAGKPETGPAWKIFDLLSEMQTNHLVLGMDTGQPQTLVDCGFVVSTQANSPITLWDWYNGQARTQGGFGGSIEPP